VAIRRTLVSSDGRLCETEPKTRHERQLITLAAETVTVFRKQAARQLAEQEAPHSLPSLDHLTHWVACRERWAGRNGVSHRYRSHSRPGNGAAS